METIEVWRGQSTTDTDGNPIQGKPVRVGTFQAMVAPTSTTDQTEENASPQTIEYTIHIRGSQPTGIQATDLIKVRGILLPVKGNRKCGTTSTDATSATSSPWANGKDKHGQTMQIRIQPQGVQPTGPQNETLRSRMRDAAEAAVEDDRCMVRDHDGKNRSGVAIICPAPVEKAHGTLEDTLGRMRV